LLIEGSRPTWGILNVTQGLLKNTLGIILSPAHGRAQLTALPGDGIGACTDPDAADAGSLFGDMA